MMGELLTHGILVNCLTPIDVCVCVAFEIDAPTLFDLNWHVYQL